MSASVLPSPFLIGIRPAVAVYRRAWPFTVTSWWVTFAALSCMSKWNVVLVAPPWPPCCDGSVRSASVREGCCRSGSASRSRARGASGSAVAGVAGCDDGGGVCAVLRCVERGCSVDCWATAGSARTPARSSETRIAYGFIMSEKISHGFGRGSGLKSKVPIEDGAQRYRVPGTLDFRPDPNRPRGLHTLHLGKERASFLQRRKSLVLTRSVSVAYVQANLV